MPFANSHDADVRLLGNQDTLTPEEVRDLIPWVRQISEPGMRRLNIELSLQNLQAIQKFEKSSSRLAAWLIVFTAVLAVLTCILVWLARK